MEKLWIPDEDGFLLLDLAAGRFWYKVSRIVKNWTMKIQDNPYEKLPF